MARKFPWTKFTPMRIGAIVSKGAEKCHGTCGPQHQGQAPHVQPDFRYTLLLFVAVVEKLLPEMDENTLIGGPFTPPVDVAFLRAARNQATSQLLRPIGWN